MNKQQLASKIWESANRMRSKIEANEYKDYILGFIFYKYLSDNQTNFLLSEGFSQEEVSSISENTKESVYVQNHIGYFISHQNLFSSWLALGKSFDVSNVRDALSAFSRNISPSHEKLFKGIFDTLQTGLSKLGDTSGAQTKAILGLIDLIKDIPTNGKQSYDVLGFIYEYLISMFAANAGKKAGEFYTPHEVSLVMSKIVAHHLKDKSEIQIYDPTSGSGSLLINIGHSVSKYIKENHKIKYYAQELKENTYNLTRMNLVMRGIKPDNIQTRNGDTLEQDWPFFEENDPAGTYDPLYVDAVVSNPPYSQAWDPEEKETDPRYANYGLAPRTKADYAFLLHDLFHIKPDGIMAIVLPHGVLFRGGEEGTIRKNLIEQNRIDTIIGLPANIFFGTGIPTIIMVLKQSRATKDVLIVDASKGFVKEGKNNRLRACDIKKIVDTVNARTGIDRYSRLVPLAEIQANDYNLNIPRYVDSSQESETWDLYASMFGGIPQSELANFEPYWSALPELKNDLFLASAHASVQLKSQNIKDTISNHPAVKAFDASYKKLFLDYNLFLKEGLIDSMLELDIPQTKLHLSDNLFERLHGFPLVDCYAVYQIFDEAWKDIENDLEIIQSEGSLACKKVEPNIVIKKRDGKDTEVQEGWKGKIIPFSLLEQNLLQEEYHALALIEHEYAEIPSLREALIDDIPDDYKEAHFLNEDNSDFVFKELDAEIKNCKAIETDEAHSLVKILHEAKTLFTKERELRKKIKDESDRLHMLCKTTIENLSDAQVLSLLEQKWITPYVENVLGVPQTIIDSLISKVEALASKYDTTYVDLENKIKSTQSELATMLEELTGSDTDLQALAQFRSLLEGGLS